MSEQKAQIDVLKGKECSEREIAAIIGRTKTAVHNYLSKQKSPKSTKKLGWKPLMSPTLKRLMVREG